MPDTILLQEAPPPQLHPHRFTLGEFFDVYNTTLHKTGFRYQLLDGGTYALPADAPRYDLALFLDVIEHFEKAEAWALTDILVKRCRRVLVTTPPVVSV
mgnify:CR=1 FL=1